MDKLKMHTPNLADENFAKLAALFPNAVTETINENGEVIRAIDADVLRQEISAAVVEGTQERYQFTWPDKRKSVVLANQPIAKTLRLDRAKSVGRDGTPGSIDTENIYIEGDNLDALKLLQETYLGKVKVIYIDPPYNTGNDFIYEDDFSQGTGEYLENSGQFDEEGNRLVQNTERNGRFHTDWLNMLYPRLRLAKDLLADDGVIFISIDDNEQENLKKICDEIFGSQNFIAQIVWEKVHTRKNSAINFSSSHEYILCYAKIRRNYSGDIVGFKRNLLPRNNTDAYSNPDHDPKGPWKADPITAHNYYSADYTITKPNGIVVKRPQDRYWAYSEESIKRMIAENAIVWGNGDSMPMAKRYLCDVQDGLVPVTLFSREFAGDSSSAKKQIDSLFEDCKGIFDYIKPINLITRFLQIGSNPDDIILDFFSGSATTAHAVMQLNAEDGGHRKFILVQLPEVTDEKSEARKAGYSTICEIGEERIRRAGKKIREALIESGQEIRDIEKREQEEPERGIWASDAYWVESDEYKNKNMQIADGLDIGFRVFRVDSSNMEDVYYRPADIQQDQLSMFTDNIKADRTPEDLLIQVMLDLGILLSSEIEETEIAGKKVFSVADGY
ncbi:MAG: site-specific DNA-methyltransferase, partial [Ruminococcus flavefaciens]|nr:site-specific DNA-methyltransferase [Ruminococcus flavefaciens]